MSAVMGGGIGFLGNGLARCGNPACGWGGVPTVVKGKTLQRCPACGNDVQDQIVTPAKAPVKAGQGKNAPCPCGSGKKRKKCCG
jgi:hypothetical protein